MKVSLLRWQQLHINTHGGKGQGMCALHIYLTCVWCVNRWIHLCAPPEYWWDMKSVSNVSHWHDKQQRPRLWLCLIYISQLCPVAIKHLSTSLENQYPKYKCAYLIKLACTTCCLKTSKGESVCSCSEQRQSESHRGAWGVVCMGMMSQTFIQALLRHIHSVQLVCTFKNGGQVVVRRIKKKARKRSSNTTYLPTSTHLSNHHLRWASTSGCQPRKVTEVDG